ncbi:MAG: LysR family transcriptional regulator [Verrucomicrobia bacterium]|nr:LysR family transcriptional regulator [Verrucomicrobiota bacterium]
MNIHHLELFYYVARHGGISEAVRNIPYGIQQPAVSSQILQLEDWCGTKLFQRRPFALTPAGEKLYGFIQPFFKNLPAIGDEIRGGATQQIRIGASQIVLRDHLPHVIKEVRKEYPQLKLSLREGPQPELERLLSGNEIDLAATAIEKRPQPGIHSLRLLELPLVLLVKKSRRIQSANELWARDRIDEPLLCLPISEAITRNFQAGLRKLQIDWPVSVELSSLDLIRTYVENDYGIGLSVPVPNACLSKNLRALPLDGFDPVHFGLMWQSKPTALTSAFVDAFKRRAHQVTVNKSG